MRRLTSIALILLVVAACGGDDDAPSATPGAQATAGPAQTSTENRLPDGFPQDFPQPPDGKIVYSISLEGGWSVFFDSSAEHAALRRFYAEALPKGGWVLSSCEVNEVEGKPLTVIISQKGPELLGVVSIGALAQSDQIPSRYNVALVVSPTPARPMPEKPVACPA